MPSLEILAETDERNIEYKGNLRCSYATLDAFPLDLSAEPENRLKSTVNGVYRHLIERFGTGRLKLRYHLEEAHRHQEKNDFSACLGSYRAVLNIQPQNSEARYMVPLLEERLRSSRR